VGLGFRVLGLGLRLEGLGFRVQGSGFRVQGSGFRVQGPGSGFKIQGSGFRVQGSGFTGTGTAGAAGTTAADGTAGGAWTLRVEGVGLRVEVFGFRFSVFGFRVSGFRFRISGFGFRVDNQCTTKVLNFHASGFRVSPQLMGRLGVRGLGGWAGVGDVGEKERKYGALTWRSLNGKVEESSETFSRRSIRYSLSVLVTSTRSSDFMLYTRSRQCFRSPGFGSHRS